MVCRSHKQVRTSNENQVKTLTSIRARFSIAMLDNERCKSLIPAKLKGGCPRAMSTPAYNYLATCQKSATHLCETGSE